MDALPEPENNGEKRRTFDRQVSAPAVSSSCNSAGVEPCRSGIAGAFNACTPDLGGCNAMYIKYLHKQSDERRMTQPVFLFRSARIPEKNLLPSDNSIVYSYQSTLTLKVLLS